MVQPHKALDIYLSRYQNSLGTSHDLLAVFQQVQVGFGCRRALYPGSYLHVTPSLVFPVVCYLDSLKGICKALDSPDLHEYIHSHKNYHEDAEIRCYEEDYSTFQAEPGSSFDLLISLNAGFISQACKHFLKPGGLLLVNDEHHDASRASVDPDYQLLGAFVGESQTLDVSENDLCTYFKTRRGERMTLEMVEANATRPPSKRRFKLLNQANVYLFKRSQVL